jgi:hypothetical protein
MYPFDDDDPSVRLLKHERLAFYVDVYKTNR